MASKVPGVMIYFNTINAFLPRMTNDEAGELFKAIVSYAQGGAVIDLDGIGGVALDLLRPVIDADAEKYGKTVDKRRYAVYCREAEKNGEKPLDFDGWMFSQRVF